MSIMSNNKHYQEYRKFKRLYKKLKGGEIFKIHVSTPWFDLIKRGLKTVEGRLNKNDFAKMRVNDKVIFFNKELNQEFSAQITKIENFKTFEEMITKNTLAKVLPTIDTIDNGVQVYYKYYTPEQETQFGVVAIHVKILE